MKHVLLKYVLFSVMLSLCLCAQEIELEIKAKGTATISQKEKNPAQAKLMAERAAKIVAQRNLLNKLLSIFSNEEKQLNNFSGFLAGVYYSKPVVLKDEMVEVEASLSLVYILKRYSELIKQLEEFQKQSEKQQQIAEKLHNQHNTLQQENLHLQQIAERLRKRNASLQKNIAPQITPDTKLEQLSAKLNFADEKSRILQEHNDKLEKRNQDIIQLLSRVNQELTNLWLKYQKQTQELIEARENLAHVHTKLSQEQQTHINDKNELAMWKNRYNSIWEAYYKLLETHEQRSSSSDVSNMEETLKNIYVSQQVLFSDYKVLLENVLAIRSMFESYDEYVEDEPQQQDPESVAPPVYSENIPQEYDVEGDEYAESEPIEENDDTEPVEK